MKIIGSQRRETLEESGYKLHRRLNRKEVILYDGQYELWCLKDDHAGYTIEIDGKGYEFVRAVFRQKEIG